MDYILHRKDRLIITTIDIIDDLGIQGLSTREIAKREGVSEATLFRHYKNKNDLLIAVLEYFSQFDEDIFQTTRLKGLKPREAITFFISSTFEYYENYPAITAIIQMLDFLRYEKELTEKVYEVLNGHYGCIKLLVDEAQIVGEIRPDVDSDNLTALIIGSCREICLKWRVNNRNFSLKERTISTLKMLLDSFGLNS